MHCQRLFVERSREHVSTGQKELLSCGTVLFCLVFMHGTATKPQPLSNQAHNINQTTDFRKS
jgi:hypothetical protein